MALNVNLDALCESVKRMGVPLIDDFVIDLTSLPDEQFDIDLGKGIRIKDLKHIEIVNGLLVSNGRQILLYIQDHGWRVDEVLEDGSKGNKFHVSDCRTLKKMREYGKKERYVITNALSSDFFVSGVKRHSSEPMSGRARLDVCKNCLYELNYKGYKTGGDRKVIFGAFTQEEFFATYISFFPHRPIRFAGPMSSDNYSSKWHRNSSKYRKEHNHVCEECSLDLSDNKELLHVHHMNGRKNDDRPSNLKALCIACHRKQPCHGHMYIDPKTMRKITRLRREQGMLEGKTWEEVAKMVDSGIGGLVCMCDSELPVPKVSHEILGDAGNVITEVDLAWPRCRFGIAIREENIYAAGRAGWEIWEEQKARKNFAAFGEKIRYQGFLGVGE